MHSTTKCIPKGPWADHSVGRGSGTPWKITGCYVFLEIMVWVLLEKQLDPRGPIATRGRSVRPSVKYNSEP